MAEVWGERREERGSEELLEGLTDSDTETEFHIEDKEQG